jgi:hypothetical protein
MAAGAQSQDYAWDHTVDVFPNPAEESIVVRFWNHKQPFSINITDIYGRSVYNKDYANNYCNFEVAQQRIAVDALLRGSYFIAISCQGKVVTRKIVLI